VSFVYASLNGLGCTVTSHGLHNPGFKSRERQCIRLFSERVRVALGPNQLQIQGYLYSFPRAKYPGLAVYHWPPCRAKIKKEWSHNPTPPSNRYIFMAWMGNILSFIFCITLTPNCNTVSTEYCRAVSKPAESFQDKGGSIIWKIFSNL
jgi:hypothetical protein